MKTNPDGMELVFLDLARPWMARIHRLARSNWKMSDPGVDPVPAWRQRFLGPLLSARTERPRRFIPIRSLA